MNQMRKMTLIPDEMAQKLLYQQRHKEDTRPSAYHAMNIDKDMQDILSRNDLGEYDKAMRYMQLLHKYLETLHSREQFQTSAPPITPPSQSFLAGQTQQEGKSIDAVETKPSIHAMTPLTAKTILESVPKYSKPKARKLIKLLTKDPDFQWGGDGEVSIKGEVVKGSNIKNIIKHASTNPKHSIDPTGIDTVLSYLSKKNMTSDTITNRRWKNELNIKETPKTPFSTPLGRRGTPLDSWLATSSSLSSAKTASPLFTQDKGHEWESWK